ncbi:VOC family protein [Streptomyces sp. NBC_01520]|uniref:VOC family protein n=1 Tax=Streptomyces sp. NBC_01520 TaxID=2903892 RepID=UPI003866DD6B
MAATLPLLRELVGAEPGLRLAFEQIELAAIGDFPVLAGFAGARAVRPRHGAVVVADLDAVIGTLAEHGAVITTPPAAGPTGRFLYARHAGGAEVEYVEWVPELVRRIVAR